MVCHRSSIRVLGFTAALAVTLMGASLAAARAPLSAQTSQKGAAYRTGRLIIRLRESGTEALVASTLQRLGSMAGMDMRYVRGMSSDLHLVALPREMSLEEARAVAADLLKDPNVEIAEPDRVLFPALLPNDTNYPSQWDLKSPDPATDNETGGANFTDAWEVTTGAPDVVVAIIDTGLLPHADLDTNILDSSGRVVPGYDFVSLDSFGACAGQACRANDGDGRDANPTDPGDWLTSDESNGLDSTGGYFSGCPVQNSSWHGTHVAGTVASNGNNSLGVTGANWHSKILPVRVLGKCGGLLSDIIDGMAWAAGLDVPGTPRNTHRAQVVNLSLRGAGACSTLMQQTIDRMRDAGTLVVAAAGNDGAAAGNFLPGNCRGVFTVAANDRTGAGTWYSNTGLVVDITAPGGDFPLNPEAILSLGDSGLRTARNDSIYSYKVGTSMAAPHVSGLASLLISEAPSLGPELIKRIMVATARPFPELAPSCQGCGAGIIDAGAALTALGNPPAADAGPDQLVNPDVTVNLDGSGSSDPDGRVVAFRWTQTGGETVSLSQEDTSTAVFMSGGVTGDTFVFELTVTDDLGLKGTDTTSVVINGPPAADAGEKLTVLTRETVRLDGSASTDAEGKIQGYSWTQTEGETVVLTGADTARPEFTAPETRQTLGFELTVTDELGLTDSATVEVLVLAPPEADAGLDRIVNSGDRVGLDGSASSDPDGQIAAYAWTQTGGEAVTLRRADTATPSFVAPARPQTLSFQLTVTDNDGIEARDTVSVTINIPPQANAGADRTVLTGEGITLDGAASSDPDGTIQSYHWTQTAGATVALTGADSANPSFTAPATAQTLTFELQVTDNIGATHTDSVRIRVNSPPVAAAGPDLSVFTGAGVALDGSGSSDANGSISAYAWRQTSGDPVNASGTNTARLGFTAPAVPQTLVFELTVTDNDGATASDSVQVSVSAPPTVTPPDPPDTGNPPGTGNPPAPGNPPATGSPPASGTPAEASGAGGALGPLALLALLPLAGFRRRAGKRRDDV